MSTYIIVETDARLAKGVYISQQTLEVVVNALKNHPTLMSVYCVYELRINEERSLTAPSGCASLWSAAIVKPPDLAEYHRLLLANVLTDLPLEQAKLEWEKTKEHIENKLGGKATTIQETSTGPSGNLNATGP